MHRGSRLAAVLILAAVALECSPDDGGTTPGDASREDARREDGAVDVPCDCGPDEICVPGLGCRDCWPDRTICVGNEVWQCTADGRVGSLVESCAAGETCQNGICLDLCERAEDEPSNVGCHFYAVDLDSGVSPTEGLDACAEQYAVAIANMNDFDVQVDVYRNTARFGDPVAEEIVATVVVPPDDLVQIDLPQREVDGAMGQNGAYTPNGGSGTFVSSHAYRLESNAPVVAYQFQPIVQTYSNDASVLVPRQALGEKYWLLSWPAANHCSVPSLGPLGKPWHGAVTIVGVYENTNVTVVPSHPVAPSGGDSGLEILQTPAGERIDLVIGPYDVVNLESDVPVATGPIDCLSYADQDGDFSGTLVTADRPIAVFAGSEASFGYDEVLPASPGGGTCCADHLEEQFFPVTALGWKYVVSRSPVRSFGTSYEEPDLYRVLATVNGTVVTTSLAAPFDRFELDEGQWATFYADTGFTAEAVGGAVLLVQYLVAAEYVLPEPMGDPSTIVFPAAEQHRNQYVFLVPTTWEDNYMALALPEGTAVDLDGAPATGGDCERRPIGELDGTTYEQLTCLLSEGVHRVEAPEPFGLSVYGYFTAGSYGYPGGADVDIINPII
jgi:hypothetical protein